MIYDLNELLLDTLVVDYANVADPGAVREDRRHHCSGLYFMDPTRFEYAEARLNLWLKLRWPSWDGSPDDEPEEFGGTVPCPYCGEWYLVIDNFDVPFCFGCNQYVHSQECDSCGDWYLESEGCACSSDEVEQI